MSEPAQSSLTHEQRAHQAEAHRDVLLEALEIFTHDLSNPLQSLVVLTELALDDAPPNTEDYERCRQSLEAAERMKVLMQGLGGLARNIDSPRNTAVAVDRFASVLSRRWERHSVRLTIDLGTVGRTPSPANLETLLLNLGLGAVAVAADRSHPRYDLSLTGTMREGEALPCAIELTLAGHNAGGSGAPITLSRRHIDRAIAMVDGNPAMRVSEGAEAVLIEFAPEPRRQ